MEQKPLIIFDTDMDTDCDDAGALLLLINAHKKAQIDLIGVIADSDCYHAAPFCTEILSYCGLDVPVGQVHGYIENPERLSEYHAHQKACEDRAYNKTASKSDKEIRGATSLYLSLLKNAPDKGVSIVCVGMLTAVYEAIKADTALFEQKVSKVIIMGNPYKKNDFNFSMDAISTKGFFELCPVFCYISYLGSEIITGNYLDKALQGDHPVRRAYEIWSGTQGRSSWDLIAALYALNPSSDIFKTVEVGKISYDVNERVATVDKTGTRDTVIGLSITNDEMEKMLNNLLI